MTRTSGFTLLEVMVALLIVAISLTAVMKANIENTRTTSYLQTKTVAHWVAWNKVSEYRAGERKVSLNLQTESGQENMLGQAWEWTAQFQSVPDIDALRLTVSVREASSKKLITQLIAFLPAVTS
jgi:general secretion pathway protein I